MSTIAVPSRPTIESLAPSGPLVGRAHAPIATGEVLRRLAVAIAAGMILLASLVWVLQVSVARAGDVSPPAASVVVQPGDTIWQLATQHRPAGVTTQDYAMTIVLHNDVDATALIPGSVLELPGVGSR